MELSYDYSNSRASCLSRYIADRCKKRESESPEAVEFASVVMN